MDMITAQDLRFQYEYPDEPPHVVLEGVDLRIEKGSFVALLGHNGCGKSTLAKHMNAMLLPTGGRVLVKEMDTADEEQKYEIRRTVGMVLQNPDNQLVSTIVEEDVGFGPENLGVPPQEIRQRVDQALADVDMTRFAAGASHALSGGQKQRVAIAGMLAMRPEVLVLDEATAMLDPRGRREVLSVVERLHRERGMTVVMITQYMEEVAPCDRVVVMDGGRIALAGTPRQIFRDPDALRAAGLDTPEAVQMRDALTRGGVPLQGDPITIEELADAICQSLSNN